MKITSPEYVGTPTIDEFRAACDDDDILQDLDPSHPQFLSRCVARLNVLRRATIYSEQRLWVLTPDGKPVLVHANVEQTIRELNHLIDQQIASLVSLRAMVARLLSEGGA